MSRPTSMREVRMGLVVLVALGAIAGLVALAGGGPGFLGARRSVDVVFRDGQGIRAGSPVRIAGIDAGRVQHVDLVEVEGILKARVRLVLPADIVARLRQDARITIQAGLTGQSHVNIVSSGRSTVALVPGQRIEGVESSFFDPVLEQVGLGPVERKHLSHTIAEVRQTVDAAGPRLRQVLGGLQETVANLRETTEAIRPAVETSAGRLEALAKRIDPDKLEATIEKIASLAAEAEGLVAENRPALKQTLAGARDLSANLNDLIVKTGPPMTALVGRLDGTRARVDRFVDRSTALVDNSGDLLTANRANLDRTITNVKDASDLGQKLVGKLYGNPFYLSPFYKPTKEDLKAQEVYDAANTFMTGAKELNDAVTTLKLMQAKGVERMTPAEKVAYDSLFKKAWALTGQLNDTSRAIAEGMRPTETRRR